MATMNNYFLTSYTNDTYTDIAQPGSGEVLIVRNIILCNTDTSSSIEVSIRITDSSGTQLAVLQQDLVLSPEETIYIGPQDLFIVLDSQQKLQVDASAANVHFTVCGGIE